MATYEPGPDQQPADGRLIGAIRRMLASALALAQTRAELAATEFQEEVHRAAAILLWSLVALAFTALAVLMIGATVIIAFWEDHRLLAAILVSVTYIVIAIGTALLARARMRAKGRFLSTTLDELKRDREAVEAGMTVERTQ